MDAEITDYLTAYIQERARVSGGHRIPVPTVVQWVQEAIPGVSYAFGEDEAVELAVAAGMVPYSNGVDRTKPTHLLSLATLPTPVTLEGGGDLGEEWLGKTIC